MTRQRLLVLLVAGFFAAGLSGPVRATREAESRPQGGQTPASPPQDYASRAERALAEDFKGITTDGAVVPGLFSIRETGVSTEPIREAAELFLASLSSPFREKTIFPVDSDEWRRWSNIHRYPRRGVSIGELDSLQRERAVSLLKTSLSVKGFETARDIMRLNETVAELTGRRDEYGEGLYWFTVMGTPSADQPWGWQLDGHHLVINYFVLGDQVVVTPTFMGSEPVRADSGKYAGTRVFEDEESSGLALIKSLTREQRGRAVVSAELPGDVFTAAFRDNFEMRYEGIDYDELSPAQQTLLLSLIETYVGNIRPGHARIRLEEVKKHLPDTYFAWMGGFEDDSVFYYRVHSPVILIEFDHQRGVALRSERHSRNHIHTVVRTPNGNDYGKDLLRQHHERHHRSRSN